MGTRSLTHVKGDVWKPGEEAKTILTIYRQMDGYPTGMGEDIASFLRGRTITNGIGDTSTPTSNGMGDLAAQLLMTLKADQPNGGIYVYAPDSSDCGEEYVYTIDLTGTRNLSGDINLKVESVYRNKVIFEGRPEDFDGAAIEATDRGSPE